MQEMNNENNIVETLRLKTEEADIKQYLRSTLGGYTKNSVMDYLNILRKQQQAMADTFSHNQQVLFEEKENLKKVNEALKLQINRVGSEYQDLSQSLRINKLGEDGSSDVEALKNNIAALEVELHKADIEKSRLEKQREQQKTLIHDLSLKLEQSAQEKQSMEEMLKAEMLKTKDHAASVSKLSSTIEEKDDEIKFLKTLIADGELANLNAKINDLTEQLALQVEVISNCNNENSLKFATIELLTRENDTIKQIAADLSKNLEDLNSRNDNFLAANKALTDQLETEYKRSIDLIKERSAMAMDKLTAIRKLDEANSKILLMELELKNK